MKALDRCAVFLSLLALAGCTASVPAQDAQVAVTQAIDCDRLGATINVEAGASDNVGRSAVPVGPQLQVRLPDLRTVSPALPPGRKEKSEGTFAGLVPFRVEASGTYAVLVASVAWADLGQADPLRLVKPKSFHWVTVCGKRFKSGFYVLEPGKPYFLQLWDSPDRELTLMIRRLP